LGRGGTTQVVPPVFLIKQCQDREVQGFLNGGAVNSRKTKTKQFFGETFKAPGNALPGRNYDVYSSANLMTRRQILDLYFLDARHKLVELAAFLDRVERAGGAEDFRLRDFRTAAALLGSKKRGKAKAVLLTFSDPTRKPLTKAEGKGSLGAWKRK
jgi:hypothetical protein